MSRVTGIGGIFFKAKDPVTLRVGTRRTWVSTYRSGEALRFAGLTKPVLRWRERLSGPLAMATTLRRASRLS